MFSFNSEDDAYFAAVDLGIPNIDEVDADVGPPVGEDEGIGGAIDFEEGAGELKREAFDEQALVSSKNATAATKSDNLALQRNINRQPPHQPGPRVHQGHQRGQTSVHQQQQRHQNNSGASSSRLEAITKGLQASLRLPS